MVQSRHLPARDPHIHPCRKLSVNRGRRPPFVLEGVQPLRGFLPGSRLSSFSGRRFPSPGGENRRRCSVQDTIPPEFCTPAESPLHRHKQDQRWRAVDGFPAGLPPGSTQPHSGKKNGEARVDREPFQNSPEARSGLVDGSEPPKGSSQFPDKEHSISWHMGS